MNAGLLRLRDRLEQIEIDLAELEEQVDAGELDEVTADRLRSTYLAERDEVQSEVDRAEQDPSSARRERPRGRVLVGAVILGVGALVIVAAAIVSLQDRDPGGSATGGIVDDVVRDGGVDLSTVTNEELEAVVAQNPGVVGMRMALARRYFDAGDFSKALEHYLIVLEVEEHPEALANVGWMTHVSGRSDLAVTFVSRSLEIAPDFPQARWFMAVIRYEGLDDACGSIGHFDRVLADDGLPDDIRPVAEQLLQEAKEAC